LALGAWGAVQATAAGASIALGGIIRDVVAGLWDHTSLGPATGYIAVYSIELVLLFATLIAMYPLLRKESDAPASQNERPEPEPATVS
jgi:BCD family chlorophyll transporter-like MFS transporter